MDKTLTCSVMPDEKLVLQLDNRSQKKYYNKYNINLIKHNIKNKLYIHVYISDSVQKFDE